MKNLLFAATAIFVSRILPAQQNPVPLPQTKNDFVVIAHRGNHVQVPENTVASIEEAIKAGADYAEIDLRTTKDGYLVLSHDATVDRMTNGKGNVKDLTVDKIKKLKILNPDKSDTKTYRVPQFSEILTACRKRINIYLDFKDADVQETYRQIKAAGMEKQVVVYLNKESQYSSWRKTAPDMPLMISLPETIKTKEQLGSFLSQMQIKVVDNIYDSAMVAEARKKEVSVWLDVEGADENPAIWKDAMSKGIQGMQTDHPGDLVKYLNENNLRNGLSNTTKNHQAAPSLPKIIIGMMVDQMRWDYLYRFQNRYTEGGFKRLLREGFSCENTLIDYVPTVTACGHTCVYTGSVPAINGIIGNEWYDREKRRVVGCVNDDSVTIVGSTGGTGQSPHNNLSTTITDQLRIATNYQSKTVGVAIKDRASILPAGHAATAAFWFSSSDGNFITSTYYMKELPDWAKRFNEKKIIDAYYENDWETLYPVDTYTLSTADDKAYENTANGDARPVFPHLLKQFKGKNYNAVRTTPYGNTLTFDFAKAAIEGYDMGGGKFTDFLAISFSSPDAIGHTYGPNSIEQEDNFLRLDEELADFFTYLDNRFGKGNYLYFLTADHGVSESPGYYLENKMPSGAIDDKDFSTLVNRLKEKFKIENPILSFSNDQIYMNWGEFDKKEIDHKQVEYFIKKILLKSAGIADVLATESLGTAPVPDIIKSMLIKGYNVNRSGDFDIIPQPTWKNGSINGATHGTWYPYDAHIPLVWMGWKIKTGHTNRVTGMSDISPTLAALLHIQMPSGAIGRPITEITNADSEHP